MEQKIWWYAVNNEQKGPISYDELSLLINQNFVDPNTLVWKEGLPNWIKFSEINAQPVANVPPNPPNLNPISSPPNPINPQPHPSFSQPYQSHPQPNPSQPFSNTQQQTSTSFTGLNSVTDPYYRAEFEKIISSNETYKGKFNWWSFFFNWVWCLTKGLWQYAVAVVVINFVLAWFVSIALSNLFSLSMAILFGLRGTWFYYTLKIKNKQLF